MSDPILAFTDGDREAARLLRRSLTGLRTMDLEPGLRRDLDAVLAGRLDVRALTAHEQFRDLVRSGVERFEAEWDTLDPAERARMMGAGRRRAAADPD